jgi:hypothetical protein
MLAGDRFQQDFVAMPAGGSPITVNMIQVGTMFYYRITGNPQWQTIDLTTTPGNIPNIQSPIPNLNGYTPNGGQRTYEAAGNARQVGTESINGVMTTKYEADVDVAKLFTSIGQPPAQAAQAAAVSKMTLTLWIDADQVLRQQRVLLNSKAAGPGGALLDVVVDFTITYTAIGSPVTIAAPTAEGLARGFIAAINARDYDGVRALFDPATPIEFDPGTSLADTITLDQLIESWRGNEARLTLTSLAASGSDTVVAQIVYEATDVPPLPHPFTAGLTVTATNGRITRFVALVSEQTLKDLESLPAEPEPGMPRTGAADGNTSVILLALALVCLGAGRLLRRRGLIAR